MATCENCLRNLPPCEPKLREMYKNRAEMCPFFKDESRYIEIKSQEEKEILHQMSVMAVPKPTAYRLTKEDKKETSSSDSVSDEISNILEQIGDVQAELICRHQFGNSVRPALENTSEEDLCERGFRLFYMLRNKYQGKDAILRETKT